MEEIIQSLLAKDPQLTSLNLSYLLFGSGKINAKTFKRLMDAISQHPGLRNLDLSDNQFYLSGFNAVQQFTDLMQCIAEHPGLKSLKLKDSYVNGLELNEWKLFLNTLRKSKLEEINLDSTHIEKLEFEHFKELLDVIALHPTLKKVTFPSLFSKKLLSIFINRMKMAKNLTSINICYFYLHKLSFKTFKKFIDYLFVKSNLTEIDMHGIYLHEMSDEAFQYFMKALEVNEKVTDLNLGYCNIANLTPLRRKMLFEAFANHKGFTNLNLGSLSFHELEEEDLKLFADSIVKTKVQSLDIESSELGELSDEERMKFKLFLDCVSSNINLKHLNLRGNELNGLNDFQFKALFECLASHPTLNSLQMDGIFKFSENQCKMFFDYLSKSKLTTLNLSSYAFINCDEKTIQSLCEVLANHPTLIHLNIESNPWKKEDDSKFKYLIELLERNRKIKLDYNHCHFAGEQLSILRKLQPHSEYDIVGRVFTETEKEKNKELKKQQEEKETLEEFARHCSWHPILFGKEPVGEFEIQRRKIKDKEAQALALGIKQNATIKELSLWKNDLSKEAMEVILKGVAQNKGINTLYILENEIIKSQAKCLAEALSLNTSIRKLFLARNSLDDAALIEFFENFKGNLSELFIKNNSIDAAGIGCIAKFLQNPKNALTTLQLKGNTINDKAAVLLAKALKTNKTLTNLEITYCKIKEKGIKAIALALIENQTLNALFLEGNEIGEKGLSSLLDGLMLNSSINRLNLSHIEFNDANFDKLIKVLEKGQITSLDLESCKLDQYKLKKLTDFMVLPHCNLVALNLKGNDINQEGAVLLANVLTFNSKLQKLILSNNSIKNKGAEILSEALQQNTTLETLYLDCNRIKEEGALAISKALLKNKQLSFVDFHGNMVSEKGLSALAEVISFNRTLNHFEIGQSDAKINEALAKIFAKGLLQNKTLRHLGLNYCEFSLEAVVAFADALAKTKTIEEVSLDGCHIDAAGALLIAEALKINRSIRTISLERGLFGKEGDDALLSALEQNTSIITPYRYTSSLNEEEIEFARNIEYFILRNKSLTGRFMALHEDIENFRYGAKSSKVETKQKGEERKEKGEERKRLVEKPQSVLVQEKYQFFLNECDRLAKDGFSNASDMELMRQYAHLSYCSHEISPLSTPERLKWVLQMFKQPKQENFKKMALPILADLHWSMAKQLIGLGTQDEGLTDNIKNHLLSAYVCSRLSGKNEFMEQMADLCLEYLLTDLGSKKDRVKFISWDSSLDEKLQALQEHDQKAFEEFQLSCQQRCQELYLNPRCFAIPKAKEGSLTFIPQDPTSVPLCLTVIAEEKEEKESAAAKAIADRENTESKESSESTKSNPSPIQWLYQSKISLRLPKSSEREKSKPIMRKEKERRRPEPCLF